MPHIAFHFLGGTHPNASFASHRNFILYVAPPAPNASRNRPIQSIADRRFSLSRSSQQSGSGPLRFMDLPPPLPRKEPSAMSQNNPHRAAKHCVVVIPARFGSTRLPQ